MDWFLLQKIGFYIFLGLALWFLLRQKYAHLLLLYFWGLVFNTFYIFVGTILFPSKIIIMVMLLAIIIKRPKIPKTIRKFMLVYILFIIPSSIIGFVNNTYLDNNQNGLLRLILQLYSYFSALVPFVFVFLINPNKWKDIFSGYSFAMEIGILSGLVHWISIIIGVGFMPILRINERFHEIAGIGYGSGIIVRIYGFAGEPKNFAFTILPYILILIYLLIVKKYRISWLYHVIILGLGIFVLVLTYSSSGIISFLLGVTFILILSAYNKLNKQLIQLVVFIALLTVIIGTAGSFWAEKLHENDKSYIEFLYDRSFGRAKKELENERQEVVVFNHFINEKLFYQIFGYGPGLYSYIVPDMANKKGLIPMQSGLVLTIVDLGLMGVLLFVYYLSFIGITLIRSIRSQDIMSVVFIIATISALISNLMYGAIYGSFFYLAIALWTSQNNNIKLRNE